MESEEDLSPEEALQSRHRREAKDLRAKIQQLKKNAGGNKQSKKEAQLEIARLEAEMEARHAKELEDLKSATAVESSTVTSNEVSDKNDSVKEDVSTRKPSKQQLRKMRKQAEMEKMREEALEEAKHAVDHQKLENDAISHILNDLQLKIHEIPPDGHCLYSAVAHQLKLQGTTDIDYKSIRQMAAHEMRENPDNYKPFLINANGDCFNEVEYAEYCRKVKESAEWGGHVELQAISNALKKRIMVVQASLPVVKLGDDYDESSSLRLSYHRHAYGLGEHYNSLQSI